MSLYFWKSLGPRLSSLVSLLTLTSGYLDLISWEQKRSSTRATPLPLSWGATRSPSTSAVSPSSITQTDSSAIWKMQDKIWLFIQVILKPNVSYSGLQNVRSYGAKCILLYCKFYLLIFQHKYTRNNNQIMLNYTCNHVELFEDKLTTLPCLRARMTLRFVSCNQVW